MSDRDQPCTSCCGHGRLCLASERDPATGRWNQHELVTTSSHWPDGAEVAIHFRVCPVCRGRGVTGDPLSVLAPPKENHRRRRP